MSRPREPKDPNQHYENLKKNPKKLYDLKQREIPLDIWWKIVPRNGSVIKATDEDDLNFLESKDGKENIAIAASGCVDKDPPQIGLCTFRKSEGDICAKREHYLVIPDEELGKAVVLGPYIPRHNHYYYSLPDNKVYRELIADLYHNYPDIDKA